LVASYSRNSFARRSLFSRSGIQTSESFRSVSRQVAVPLLQGVWPAADRTSQAANQVSSRAWRSPGTAEAGEFRLAVCASAEHSLPRSLRARNHCLIIFDTLTSRGDWIEISVMSIPVNDWPTRWTRLRTVLQPGGRRPGDCDDLRAAWAASASYAPRGAAAFRCRFVSTNRQLARDHS
jgi:hypothetical protein